ncbi:5'-3' exonuclease PLD3-like [Diadema antillarum]|uniref:5'-3' exonuclease PLD3-like n=1 Tax=Diadema antillarum TaxID=105358 RepID=UPI003A852A9D
MTRDIDKRDTEELFPSPARNKRGNCVLCSVLTVFLVASIASLVFLIIWIIAFPAPATPKPVPCDDPCTIVLAESMPWNLTFQAKSPYYQSTFSVWKRLISSARDTVDISSMYWTLRGEDVFNDTSAQEGEEIFRDLMAAGTTGNVSIRIALNKPSEDAPDQDTKELVAKGAAVVHILDFDRLLGGGILHTKFWVVDNQHFYLGSANMDYRSLTQVKEVGVGVFNCSCLAKDLKKLFQVYWYLGTNDSTIPPKWPSQYSTAYNMDSPMQVKLNGTDADVFIGSSPPEFCPEGRTSDIDGLIHVINSAQKYVYIAVMDYVPEMKYSHPKLYWDIIDAKLREVAFNRKINVSLLGSYWNHTSQDMLVFLKSLAELGVDGRFNIHVKLFRVPAYTPIEHRIPFSRVSHNKYMVTDNAAYVGTSNWSGSYFVKTGGASLVVNQTMAQEHSSNVTLQQQLKALFERDWNSEHATPILSGQD